MQKGNLQSAQVISIHAPPRGATILPPRATRTGIISIHAPPRGATGSNDMWRSAVHFNSRPSARGDNFRLRIFTNRILFQFTPLREGRPTVVSRYSRRSRFQFTPLREGRPAPKHWYSYNKKFQFTPLREGRQNCEGQRSGIPNFNSRPSARGDYYVLGIINSNTISIHAPPRGATVLKADSLYNLTFQFTPLREGRRKLSTLRSGRTYFNSRPSARGDVGCFRFGICILISIHAPPRGATPNVHYSIIIFKFQFTPLREGRQCSQVYCEMLDQFQFTPLREGRRFNVVPFRFGCNHFNSRPSARGDNIVRSHPAQECYFNSRPSARGDVSYPPFGVVELISIHAPPRGATFIHPYR